MAFAPDPALFRHWTEHVRGRGQGARSARQAGRSPLPSLDAVKAEIAKLVMDKLKSFAAEVREKHQREAVALKEKVEAMRVTHAGERARLAAKQSERWARETQERADRFRAGLRTGERELTGAGRALTGGRVRPGMRREKRAEPRSKVVHPLATSLRSSSGNKAANPLPRSGPILPRKPNGTSAAKGANKGKPCSSALRRSRVLASPPLSAIGRVRPGRSWSQTEPELPMHPLIEIPELEKLTDGELILLEARLRDIILTRDLPDGDELRAALRETAAHVDERIVLPSAARQHGLRTPKLGPDVVRVLRERSWQGNVRELGNVLEHVILKASMCVSGKDNPKQASVAEVAERTLRVLKRTVPAALPGIVFLSGGQSDEEATAHLDAMNKIGNLPWRLTFSYGRALQAAALKAWGGRAANVKAAQAAFAHRARMNGLAARGEWNAGLERAA